MCLDPNNPQLFAHQNIIDIPDMALHRVAPVAEILGMY